MVFLILSTFIFFVTSMSTLLALIQSVDVAFLACPSFEQVQSVYLTAKSMLGEVLSGKSSESPVCLSFNDIQSLASAIEFMDSMCMKLVEKHLCLSNPIHSAPFYMLIEVSGSEESHNREKLDKFLEVVMEDGHVSDGTVATDMSKVNSLWALRERIAEALNSEGTVYKVSHREIGLLLMVMCVSVNICSMTCRCQ